VEKKKKGEGKKKGRSGFVQARGKKKKKKTESPLECDARAEKERKRGRKKKKGKKGELFSGIGKEKRRRLTLLLGEKGIKVKREKRKTRPVSKREKKGKGVVLPSSRRGEER